MKKTKKSSKLIVNSGLLVRKISIRMKKYYIKTFGCQMNVYDSHRVATILENLGMKSAPSIRQADLVIFNTCHIREKATEKLFSDL